MIIKLFYGDLDSTSQNRPLDKAISILKENGFIVEEYDEWEFSGIPKPKKKPRSVR